ncbi:guanine nucleotide-binding protein subunit alpha [Anaeramoeba ignava]|uniref:Guanine nucleotide-binding protein subunit alpha n=1 Tax=Anaeramoeba ignava TaxID=1746090 RepID=A0A9Q0RFG1_ANAIG|nr:guanine nucleotide-binding protein subunit alpha [Anaeramoeba ignava]
MGNCDSKGKEMFERSKKIEKKIKDDQAAFENEIKLLLLGSGDSGKSTFARQMKIVHLNGFSLKEKKEFIPPIYNNIIQNIKSLILASKRFEISLSPQNEEKAEYFEKVSPYDSNLNPEIAKNVISLWEDKIQSTFQLS